MNSKAETDITRIPIAIIGMACLFPGSPGQKAYWKLLFRGEDAIRPVPETHWSPEDYFDPDPRTADHVYSKRGGFLDPIPFDPTEFGIPPSNLEATDTSQLLGLIVAKQALDDAGYGPQKEFNHERTSVILGVTGTQELVIPLGARLGYPQWRKALAGAGVAPGQAEDALQRISESYVPWQENSFPGLLGNVVAGRMCNRLNLGGTNCVVDAACASSISALNLALLELQTGRSDMVITGGVDALNDIFMHMCFARTGILSPTDDIRPFSQNADGTLLGEGIGLLVLKPLSEAEKDGDRIYAVIRGLGSSSDGRSQSIYAPRVEGQMRALHAAYKNAGIPPSSVGLIEAHGTGTRVGDAIEFKALKKVFDDPAADTDKRPIAVGTVKSMIGHTKAAAGAAGLIKAVLALHHKILPPTIKADPVDPDLDIDNSPFCINTVTRPWLPGKDNSRRAGVSSFGFGGSNYHVVLEEHRKEKKHVSWDGSVEIIAFSGADRRSLLQEMNELKTRLQNATEQEIPHLALENRTQFRTGAEFRMLLHSDPHETEIRASLISMLDQALSSVQKENDAGRIPNLYFGSGANNGKLSFVFPGQASQYPYMGAELLSVFPEALAALEDADRNFDGNKPLSDYIYPCPTENSEVSNRELVRTEIAQPAIGAVSLAYSRILKRFGIDPFAACGHSFGELTALCAAGWMDTDTFFQLATERGRLMAEASSPQATGMTAVAASAIRITKLLRESGSDLILANRNGPSQVVLSGTLESLEDVETHLKQQDIPYKRLPVSAAFHSPWMKTAQKPFADLILNSPLRVGDIRVYGNETALPYPENIEKARQRFSNHLTAPVDFEGQIRQMASDGVTTFLEVGPKNVLTGLIRNLLNSPDAAFSMDASSGKGSAIVDLAGTLCRLAARGYSVLLDRWEDSPAPYRKPRMTISLSGANYRISPPERPATRPESRQKQSPSDAEVTKASVRLPQQFSSTIQSRSETRSPSQPNIEKEIMKTSSATATDGRAFELLREGLKSIQEMQKETARVHQQFLQTQAEASRTLQRLLESSGQIDTDQSLPEIAADFKEMPISALKTPPTIRHGASSHSIAPSPSIDSATDLAATTASALPPEPTPAAEAKTAPSIVDGLEDIILEVVSDLTGYPVEMIGLDMDIEADLGIDSIKRVEILSSVEERSPGLPTVSPEIMGSLRTLRMVLEYLSAGGSGHPVDAFPPEAPAENGATVASSVDGLEDIILEVVSDLTGYPVEMIGLDMDIEADLGIDSIKRVEILSSVEERSPGLPTVSPEIMGSLRTLRMVLEYLQGGGSVTQNVTAVEPELPLPSPIPAPDELRRQCIRLTEHPFLTPSPMNLPGNRKIYIQAEKSPLCDALLEVMKEAGVSAKRLSPADVFDPPEDLAGLLIIAGDPPDTRTEDLKEALLSAGRIAPLLKASAKEGFALYAVITKIDGGFGFKGGNLPDPLQGGMAGLVKTAALEWPGVSCLSLDLAPDGLDEKTAANAIFAEVSNPCKKPVEIGIFASGRTLIELETTVYEDSATLNLGLAQGDAVIVTGGARGVTAEAALALAKTIQPALILLGRSPAPEPEPPWLFGLKDEKAIKKAILEHEFTGKRPSPAKLESRYRHYAAAREIASNLEKIAATGSPVQYYPVDVRDDSALAETIEQARFLFGPIRGVIHGAGVLEDRLIEEKTADQFDRVFSTKVHGLLNLIKILDSDPLRHMVLFSSVAARFGNIGQADYAMANEVLNKLAHLQSVQRPECRVVAINWGPWDGGMVTPALKKNFESRGISLISPELATACLLREMAAATDAAVEVVIGSEITSSTEKDSGSELDTPSSDLALTVKEEIDVQRYPILASHVLGGSPVVPFALMTEWLGHGALERKPGLQVLGIDDMRVLKGIRLDHEKRLVRLLTGKPIKTGDVYEIPVEARDGVEHGREVVHYRARAILTDKRIDVAPSFKIPEFKDSRPYSRSIEDIYERILFHGVDLRGIKKILSYSSQGMIAEVAVAPEPKAWMQTPFRPEWIADPLVLDSALQLAILWSFETLGLVCLPSYCASYRQYCRDFSSESVTAVLEITESGKRKMKGNFAFLDKNGNMLAHMTGYEALMDRKLFKAFKPHLAA